MSGFAASDVPAQDGKTFLVTGANAGIGFETAKVLAARGARVLLGCRDRDRAEAAMQRIGAAVNGADLTWIALDQADLASVRRAAEAAAKEPRLDVLINNAGVMIPPLTRTADGFELQLGVNHLGTFALTGLLLGKLAEGPAPRVVITGSIAHRGAKMAWDDLGAERGYNRSARYGQSKLANLLFLFELNRRLRAAGSPIAAIGCHPGVSATELVRHMPAMMQLAAPLVRPLLNPPVAAAWPTLQAACDPAAQGGEYYGPRYLGEVRGPSGPAARQRNATDPAAARELWTRSEALTGVDPGLAPA